MATLVLLELKLKPEAVKTLKEMLPGLLPDTRKYAGCKDVHFFFNQEDPTIAVAVEHWETKGHYENYLAWRTEQGVMAKLGELLAAPPSIRYFDKLDA
jgi:quinol monooxygenase YgiN